MNTIDLNDFDGKTAFYHFTNKSNYESIDSNGLIPFIGNNAQGIEITKKVFFSKGNIGFLRLCDVWINWFIYRISLYESVLKYKDISEEERMNLKRKFREDFTKGLYYTEDNINYALSWMLDFMKTNIVLKLDISDKDYDSFDIDEAKSHETEEFINRMYLGYVTSKNYIETFNMHTKSGSGVDKDKISLITVLGDDSAISILKEIYRKEKEKNKNLEFAFLDKLMSYVDSMDYNIKLYKRGSD